MLYPSLWQDLVGFYNSYSCFFFLIFPSPVENVMQSIITDNFSKTTDMMQSANYLGYAELHQFIPWSMGNDIKTAIYNS